MPYSNPQDKRRWEKTHRSERSKSWLARKTAEREISRAERSVPPVEVSERLAEGGEERDTAWREYEASFGVGNPEQDDDILNLIRRRRR